MTETEAVTVTVPLWVMAGVDGTILEVNPSFAAMLGYRDLPHSVTVTMIVSVTQNRDHVTTVTLLCCAPCT